MKIVGGVTLYTKEEFEEELARRGEWHPQNMVLDIMKEQSISQRALAERLGCTQSHISQLLHQDRNMTIRSLEDALDCLGYRVEWSVVRSVALARKTPA